MSNNRQTAAPQPPTPPGTPSKPAASSKAATAGILVWTKNKCNTFDYNSYLHIGDSSFDPAIEARVPLGLPLWERQANPLYSPCPQGQASHAFKTPRLTAMRGNTVTKSGNNCSMHLFCRHKCMRVIIMRTLSEAEKAMMGKGLNRQQHLSWLKDTGIPKSNEELQILEQDKKRCEQELELLDIQILAIGSCLLYTSPSPRD